MKKYKYLIIGIVFILALVTVAILFPKLRDNYTPPIETTDVSEVKNENRATDFTVYDRNSNAVKLSEQIGKPVVVNFWATWCGYCVEELPDFNKLAAEYGDRVQFMMVDLPDGYRETKNSALSFVEQNQYTFPVFFDADYSASTAYSVQSIPMTLLIDKDGNLYKTHRGLMNESTLRQYLEILIGEENENNAE